MKIRIKKILKEEVAPSTQVMTPEDMTNSIINLGNALKHMQQKLWPQFRKGIIDIARGKDQDLPDDWKKRIAEIDNETNATIRALNDLSIDFERLKKEGGIPAKTKEELEKLTYLSKEIEKYTSLKGVSAVRGLLRIIKKNRDFRIDQQDKNKQFGKEPQGIQSDSGKPSAEADPATPPPAKRPNSGLKKSWEAIHYNHSELKIPELWREVEPNYVKLANHQKSQFTKEIQRLVNEKDMTPEILAQKARSWLKKKVSNAEAPAQQELFKEIRINKLNEKTANWQYLAGIKKR